MKFTSVNVTVRHYAGTYIATGDGQRASCTAGEINAVQHLADKLGFKNATCSAFADGSYQITGMRGKAKR